jgi:hypothetical protein
MHRDALRHTVLVHVIDLLLPGSVNFLNALKALLHSVLGHGSNSVDITKPS